MKKTILTGAVVIACLAPPLMLSASAEEAGKQNVQAKNVRQSDPMQASASMTTAAVVAVRYDSGCRAKYALSSVGYQDCLQRLPATALVGGR